MSRVDEPDEHEDSCWEGCPCGPDETCEACGDPLCAGDCTYAQPDTDPGWPEGIVLEDGLSRLGRL